MKRIENSVIDRLVFNLQKPARYTGGEYNQVRKEEALIRMALCYPDQYEVGMSNQGIMVLYAIANGIEGVACERVFAVPSDFEEKARETGVPLYTLETRTPLHELDLLGFNVSHELLYTNILQVLDLGRIPLLCRDRTDGHPIVIAGGESVSNPAPLEDFIDAFFIGDGEEGLVEILNTVKAAKANGLGRNETVRLLENVEGVYLPSTHRGVYSGENLSGIEGKKVRKRYLVSPRPVVPVRPLVSNIRIAQDRAVIEVSRGCKNLCKFCHAGYYELPCREYRPEELEELIFRTLDNTGYNELSLSSLSISDYRFLAGLLERILPRLNERGVSISLPSLRVDLDTLPIIRKISDLRKTSLTFAVESASEEIRRTAGKKLSTADLMQIIDYVFSHGWRVIKLYFMIGLPGCREHDEADAIIKLLKSIQAAARGRKEINVTVSPFIPKPHTPFQWERQMDLDYLESAIWRLRSGAPRSVTIKSHNIRSSILEGVMARGDTRLGRVILHSYRDGCRMDSWNEVFRYDLWEKNLNEIVPGWKNYLAPREPDGILPWSCIETGFEKLIETRRDGEGKITEPAEAKTEAGEDEAGMLRDSLDFFARKYESRGRIRLHLSKQGAARYIPHIDFIEIIKRSLRMIQAPVAFTQGFNKREKISLGYPLPVGVESLCELCDVDLYDDMDLESAVGRMNDHMPEGFRVLAVRGIEGRESLMALTAAIEYEVSFNDEASMNAVMRNLDAKKPLEKETKQGKKILEFDNVILAHHETGGKLHVTLHAGGESSMRIDHVALLLAEIPYEEFYRLRVVRTRLLRRDGDQLFDIK